MAWCPAFPKKNKTFSWNLLWIFNIYLLVHFGAFLFLEIIMDVIEGQILPLPVHVLLLALLIAKEFKIKRLSIRIPLNFAAYAGMLLAMSLSKGNPV